MMPMGIDFVVRVNARETFTDNLNKYTEKIHNYLNGCVFNYLFVCARNTYTESKYYSQLFKVYK